MSVTEELKRARGEVTTGNWLTIDNLDSLEVRVTGFGKLHKKDWEDRQNPGKFRTVTYLPMNMHVFWHKKPSARDAIVAENEDKTWDGQVNWSTEFMDLQERLERETKNPDEILHHRLSVRRCDRPGSTDKYGWIEVRDLGRIDGAGATTPTPATSGFRAPPVAVKKGDPAQFVAQVKAASDLPALEAALRDVWVKAKAINVGDEVKHAYDHRKFALLCEGFNAATTQDELDAAWQIASEKSAKNQEMHDALADMYRHANSVLNGALVQPAGAEAEDDVPF